MAILTTVALLGGCNRAVQAKEPMKSIDAQLTWSATAEKGALVVTYSVKNKGAGDILVADGLMVGDERVDRLVVMNGAPGVVRLIRGAVLPDAERLLDVPPATMVKLAAGKSLEARLSLPLPLAAWHNAGAVRALRPGAKTLTLEVEATTTPDGPATWLSGAPLPAP